MAASTDHRRFEQSHRHVHFVQSIYSTDDRFNLNRIHELRQRTVPSRSARDRDEFVTDGFEGNLGAYFYESATHSRDYDHRIQTLFR